MNRPHRFVASCIATLLLVCILFSIAFVAIEADHDCTGDGCTVCHQIYTCQKLLDQLGAAALPAMLAIAAARICTFIAVRPQWTICVPSPVDFKVKLSN